MKPVARWPAVTRILLLLVTLLATTAASKRSTPEPPPPVGVTLTHSGGARVLRAVLPGKVSAIELPRRADGRRDVVFLLGSEVRTFHRLDPSAQAVVAAPRALLSNLPAGDLGALDLDGDGTDELLIATDVALQSLGPASAPRSPTTVLDVADVDVLLPSRWSDRTLGGVVVAGVGRARLFVPHAGTLAAELDHPLPTRASRQTHGIRLISPRILSVAGDAALLGVAPQPVGKQRLRTLLFDAGAATEAWSLLPKPEDVDEARYATLDGKPALIVTTTNADKLGIFEGKKLRIFVLAADRTQAGRAPVLAAQTTSHRWFPVETSIADVDHDGHQDAIVVQCEGMGGGDTIVETFFGRGDGAFITPGRRQKWELRSEGTSYGDDVTGDGVADLVVLDEDGLAVVAGTTEPRRALLAREPIRVPIALGEGGSIHALRTADLDGDGRSEVILHGGVAGDHDVIAVVSFDRPAAAPVSAARGN